MRVRFDDYLLDPGKKTLHKGEERIVLTPTPFRVLEFLIENRARVVPKDELLSAVWGAHRGKDTVEHAVSSIRRALGDDKDHPTFIETVPGHGYRFIAEVAGPDVTDSPEVTPRPEGIVRRKLLLSGGCALGLAGIGLFSLAALRRRTIGSLALNGQKLIASDNLGAVLWEYSFERPLITMDEWTRRRRVRLLPWERRGGIAVVAAVGHPMEGSPIADEVLYCISGEGKLAWTIPVQLDLNDAYGAPFEPGWEVSDLLVTGGQTRPARLWVSLVHHLRFASGVLEVTPQKKSTVRFANAGHVQRLCALRDGGSDLVVAGGVNNVVDRNCVAIFGEEDPPAMSPDLGVPHYHYRNEPLGLPRAYAILPTSEYNTLGKLPYAQIAFLYPGNGSILIRTSSGTVFSYSFEFGPDLRPLKALPDGGQEITHRRLEIEHLVPHDYAGCPERSRTLKMKWWTPMGHWQELEIPWSGPNGDRSKRTG
jgi:DNA-binding winged helix-turn-helix (wHTH) protein